MQKSSELNSCNTFAQFLFDPLQSSFTLELSEIQILPARKSHITISISEKQQGNVSLFGFSASVFLQSHLRTTPPHTWPEMDGDRTVAR